MFLKKGFIGIFIVAMASGCADNANNNASNETTTVAISTTTPIINYTVLNVFPHDTGSFTQGLLIHDGILYESTGSGGQDRYISWAGTVDLKTGKPDKKIILNKKYFGEGISIIKGKMYQLTWQDRIGFVYDAKTFKKLADFSYPGEGWALTHDSTHLIMSDGTNKLQYIDPETLKVAKIIGVEDHNGPVANLNELEYIGGFIYANQFLTNYILKIDAASGRVVGRLDLTNLHNEAKGKFADSQETNGIAYDPATQKIYVTGKCWPNLYEIKLN